MGGASSFPPEIKFARQFLPACMVAAAKSVVIQRTIFGTTLA
jgi:hypothetical protein